MLESTAGPPRKPVFEATNSSPASKASTSHSAAPDMKPSLQPKLWMIEPNTTAFSVCPSTGFACHSRYSKMMPPAVKASDSAMYNMVSLPVCTRGSASDCTLFDTASIPV
jgi:hypothetical protein